MYRLSHEFAFQAMHVASPTSATNLCPADRHLHHFTGQLIFKGHQLNSYGTLHTENDLRRFADVLNSLTNLPELWTLELVAKELYNYAVGMFPDLQTLSLYQTNAPYRMAEYTADEEVMQDNSVLMLDSIQEDSPVN